MVLCIARQASDCFVTGNPAQSLGREVSSAIGIPRSRCLRPDCFEASHFPAAPRSQQLLKHARRRTTAAG